MPPGCLPVGSMHVPLRGEPDENQEHAGVTMFFFRECLAIPPEELTHVAGEREPVSLLNAAALRRHLVSVEGNGLVDG